MKKLLIILLFSTITACATGGSCVNLNDRIQTKWCNPNITYNFKHDTDKVSHLKVEKCDDKVCIKNK